MTASNIMAHNIEAPVATAELHVAVVRSVPAVEDLLHLDHPLAEMKAPWRRLVTVIGVAFDVNADRVQAGRPTAASASREPMRYDCIPGMLVPFRFSARGRPCKDVDTVCRPHYVWHRNGVWAIKLRSNDPQN